MLFSDRNSVARVERSETRGGIAALHARRISLSLNPGYVRSPLALAERGFAGIGHRDPLRVGRGAGHVSVVPVPPLVRPALRIALRRILPFLLAAECRHVE